LFVIRTGSPARFKETEMIDYGTTLPKDLLLLIACQGSRVSNEAAAKAWVEASQKVGFNPQIVQQSLSSDDPGEWHITTSTADHSSLGHPVQLPDELWEDVFLILEASGDVVHDPELKCWHGAVLLDDAGQSAIALRLRLAQHSLNLSAESFYAPLSPEIHQTHCEHGFSEDDLRKLCECHGIPEEWLTSGEPAELELLAQE
jgi:hypothetical protein